MQIALTKVLLVELCCPLLTFYRRRLMKQTVFWSWQSDLPEELTRHFIKRALVAALQKVSEDLEPQVSERLEIDHDTKDEAGLVEIVSTIFRKIDD